jgi:uncharacterized integral membrane protein (TIGR00697 family)
MTYSEKIYIGLCILFSVLIVIGNLVYQKFVSLHLLPFHIFTVSAGAVLYPLTFLITDLITEFYGKDKAQFCIRFAAITSILTALIIAFLDFLPSADWSKVNNADFHKIFGMYIVAFGSIFACYVAQAIDIILYMWIRNLTKGKHLWLRNNGSITISLFVDTSVMIGLMTLFGVIPKEQMCKLIMNSYSYKLFFTVCSTPLFYLCVSLIRFFNSQEK